jgi:PKD repeat protein
MKRRVILFIAVILVTSHTASASSSGDLDLLKDNPEQCTVGVASGLVTTDKRALLWKVRDIGQELARQQLMYISGSPYSCIGICTEGGGIYMGLSESGVASGNSLVRPIPGLASNSSVQIHILRNFETVDQIDDYFWSGKQAGTCNASGCFPFIDAQGNAAILEVNRSEQIWEYNSPDPARQAQGLYGFVVRANEFHMEPDGRDNTTIGGRYASGMHNILGFIDDGGLSVAGLIQGASDSKDYYEFVRYGPSRELATIARDTTHSAIVVHGVLPDEDPALATMWVMLGQTNYSVAVPAWVVVSDIPPCLASGDMYDRATSLFAKRNEETTQASIFPLEAHFFDVVLNTLLPRWRVDGVAPDEMIRVEHQFAADAYSLLDCLDRRRADNRAPDIDFEMLSEGLSFQFILTANDIDGSIATIVWDFGDGYTSTEHSPSHIYTARVTYLISCTVTDNDGVSVTQYKYSVPLVESVIVVDDDASNDPGPGDPNLSDPNEDGSAEHPFDSIQKAINMARRGNNVMVMPGMYVGWGNRDLDFQGKSITVFSQFGPGTCVIDCQGLGRGFNFNSGEGCDSVLEGFTIINGRANYGGAISCTKKSSPTIKNCIFSHNSAYVLGGAVSNFESAVSLINCTFHANTDLFGGGAVRNMSDSMVITNCILWCNEPGEIFSSGTIDITYCNISGGWEGEGNINTDPLFSDMDNGDYHLKSQAGRWDPNSESWVKDEVTSLCIDAGEPNSDWSGELWPHGGRVNMGAYGGTREASLSTQPQAMFLPRIAYIYSSDSEAAGNFQSLLVSYGCPTNLVELGQPLAAALESYDLIIVGNDTENASAWDDLQVVNMIQGAGKPIIGMGEGGYDFFGMLGLDIGRPNGMHGDSDSIKVIDPSHPLFVVPYAIEIPQDRVLRLYTQSLVAPLSLGPVPESVMLFAWYGVNVGYYLMALQDNRYFFWGFTESPQKMTEVGKNLFINVVLRTANRAWGS